VKNIIVFLVGIVVGNSNKLPKWVGRKIQLNGFKFGPMTLGTLLFNEFLS